LNYKANTQGYDLHEKSPSEWVLDVKGYREFVGPLKDVGVLAAKRFGFEIGEIEAAVNCMARNGEDSAHFGMGGSFLYTFNREKAS